MDMKTNIIVTILVLLLITLSLVFFAKYQNAKKEAQRQKQNVEILNKNYKTYKNAFGETIAQVDGLKYTIDELKTNEQKLYKELKDNKIKLKNVQAITEIRTVTKVQFKTITQYVDSAKCFSYKDKWNTVEGCFTTKDTVAISIETRDSLNIIPEIIPKYRFLFWTWGAKGIKLNVISKNPYTKFEYLKYIEIKK